MKRSNNKLKVLDSNNLEALLVRARKSSKTMAKVVKELTQIIETGADVSYNITIPLYFLEEKLSQSEYSLRKYNIEDLNKIESLFDKLDILIDYNPQEMIPLPDIVALNATDFLIPYPFIVEAPTLNVNIDFADTLNKIIGQTINYNDNINKVI